MQETSIYNLPSDVLELILKDITGGENSRNFALAAKRFAAALRKQKWERLHLLRPAKARELLLELLAMLPSTPGKRDPRYFIGVLESFLIKPYMGLEQKAIAATILAILYQQANIDVQQRKIQNLPAKLCSLLYELTQDASSRLPSSLPLVFALAGHLAKANKDITSFNHLKRELKTNLRFIPGFPYRDLTHFIPSNVNPYSDSTHNAIVQAIRSNLADKANSRFTELNYKIVAMSPTVSSLEAKQIVELILSRSPTNAFQEAICALAVHLEKELLIRAVKAVFSIDSAFLDCLQELRPHQILRLFDRPSKIDEPRDFLDHPTKEIIQYLSLEQLVNLHAKFHLAGKELHFILLMAYSNALKELTMLRKHLLSKPSKHNYFLTLNFDKLLSMWQKDNSDGLFASLLVATDKGSVEGLDLDKIIDMIRGHSHQADMYAQNLSDRQAINAIAYLIHPYFYRELLDGGSLPARLQRLCRQLIYRPEAIVSKLWHLLEPWQRAQALSVLYCSGMSFENFRALTKHMSDQEKSKLIHKMFDLEQIQRADFRTTLKSYLEITTKQDLIRSGALACWFMRYLLPFSLPVDIQIFYDRLTLVGIAELRYAIDIKMAAEKVAMPRIQGDDRLQQLLPTLVNLKPHVPISQALAAIGHEDNFLANAKLVVEGYSLAANNREELVAIRSAIITTLSGAPVSAINLLTNIVDRYLCQFLTNIDRENIVTPLRSYSSKNNPKSFFHTRNELAIKLIEMLLNTSDIKTLLASEISTFQAQNATDCSTSGYFKAMKEAQTILEQRLCALLSESNKDAEVGPQRKAKIN